MRYKIFGLIVFAFFLLSFIGCATVPSREALPTYNIGGVAYISLVSLCDLRGIDLKYDTFTRTLNLNKDAHRIDLRVGDNLALVDGEAQRLKYPIDIYQGMVVAPYKFKTEVLDILFKEAYPPAKVALPLIKIKKVVIDAGHGGNDPGAIGKTGLREKDITLDIAKRLSSLLKKEGIAVAMTRQVDKFIPLAERVEIANNFGADLFISIHVNANRVKSLNGFEIYYISPYMDLDSQRALFSAKNARLNLEDACLVNSSTDLKAIIWDMIYTSSRAESIEVASAICQAIDRNLNRRILGIKPANFQVLKGVYTPAVLIEVGFLSNRNEEQMLRNTYYRQQVTEAVAEGIENYARDYTLMMSQ
jgi:N-acetylmuramoyl-L-alanine amidase